MERSCRRGGVGVRDGVPGGQALTLRPCDLNPRDCTVRLREKGSTIGWQSVSPTLMAALLAHADEPAAVAEGNCCATATDGRHPAPP